MMATPAEAHAEWHRNAGVPMGTPGCPQDACHPMDDEHYGPQAEPVKAVRCGNRQAHGDHTHPVYHPGVDGVRACYRNVPGASMNQVTREGVSIVPDSRWLEGNEA